MKPRFLAAFIFQSLVTLLLLGFTVQFVSSLPVRAWAQQMLPGGMVLPWQDPVPPVSAAAPAPQPSPTPLDLPVEPTQAAPQPTRAGPTPTPEYIVVEKQPPDGNLVVPSLGLNEPLTPVAVRENAWDLSEIGAQVGWLQTTGAHPGDELAMVLIGHITLPPPGGAGPFLYLSNLQPGDEVQYRTQQETYIYQVKSRDVVSPDQVDSLYRPNGSRLLLVTCTGYNALEFKYDQRLVIEAELVGVEYQNPTILEHQ